MNMLCFKPDGDVVSDAMHTCILIETMCFLQYTLPHAQLIRAVVALRKPIPAGGVNEYSKPSVVRDSS